MTITSPDDLLRLAPDAKTLEAGRRLFYSRRWRLVGGNGQWLWGEFQFGTSAKASETAVELMTGRYRCNCRARTRPCAHGLALVLMLKNDQERITVGTQPPSWLRSVQFQAERKEKKLKAQNLPAVGDRQSARLELMTSGVEELEIRLLDVARRGIADTLAQGPEPFLAAAARLHDELLQYAGMATRKDDILAQPALEDHWLVMGALEGSDDKLRYRRVWLRAEKSRRFALLLDYAFGDRAPFERSWPLAASFQGSLHYYPGSYPQRGVFPHPTPGGRPYDGLTGYPNLAAMRENYKKAITVNPWLLAYPVYLQSVRPHKDKSGNALLDDDNELLPLQSDYQGFYTLLAISGGAPIKVFGEFDGYRFLPLSLVTGAGMVGA